MENADEEVNTNLWGPGNILVRLSSVVGDHLKRSGSGGAVARKSCALLTLLGRMGAWSDAVWESLLDQAFWKLSPGLLVWITGSHVTSQATSGDPSLENLSNKEASADALAALDVVLDVAQHSRGAASLMASSVLLFLRQGALQAKVLAADGQQLPLYVGAGKSRARNPWHTVWCRGLQVVQVLSMRASGEGDLEEANLNETLAFVVTFRERLQRVLSRTCSAWVASCSRSRVKARV